MSKRKHCDREYDDLQKLKYENRKLKRQVSSLRKQIARINIYEYENLKDLLDKHDQEDRHQTLIEQKEKDKKRWECFKCKVGYLKLKIFERRDGIFYFRKCNNCENRTKTQKWSEDVEGIE
jgi:hypothetical protein